jgi:hypothetical protein
VGPHHGRPLRPAVRGVCGLFARTSSSSKRSTRRKSARFEAYAACLHAHHPASYVFVEDLRPDTLRRFKAVLIVGQTVEMEPELRKALDDAKQAGVSIFHDDTCRAELVKGFTPLGVAFNTFEKDPSPAADDAAYQRLTALCKAHVPALRRALDKAAPSPSVADHPEVFVSERKAGDGRFLFVVNNTTPDLEHGHLWRLTLAVANLLPLQARVHPEGETGAVYDVFAGKRVEPRDGTVEADLRALPCRLFAVLPAPIDRVELHGAEATSASQQLTWEVHVRGAGQQALHTTLPVRVRLLDSQGGVLEEQFVAAADAVAKGTVTIPLNAPKAVVLEATELFGGKSARLPVQVRALHFWDRRCVP